MRIARLRIQNFRGISTESVVDIDDLNVIVGRNDAGKSTILKAIDLVLNEAKFVPDFSCNIVDSSSTIISIELSVGSTPIIIDEGIETTFEEEGLVNGSGYLELKKVWTVGKSARISPDTYLIRQKFEDDFLTSNERELIKKCEENGIDTRKGNDENYNNVEKRKKLREFFLATGEVPIEIEEKLPTSGTGRLKNIHNSIKSILPKFEYFQADSSLSESDTSIQNYFRKMAVEIFENEIDTASIEQAIDKKIGKVLADVTQKINASVPDSEKIEPVIGFDWSKLINISFKTLNSAGPVPLSSRGDGFRRIAMMSYFEYLAEQSKTDIQNIIFGFEEPETFLHPMAQESLFDKLNGMCHNGYQVMLTTHSPVIVANSDRSKLVHVTYKDNQYSIEQRIESLEKIVDDLGISPDNQFIQIFDSSLALLLVEGIDDANVFARVCDLYKENGVIEKTFSEHKITLLPVGGCGSVKHWVSLNLFATLNKPYFIVQDSDIKNEAENCNNRDQLISYQLIEHTDFHILRKRALENYITNSVINRLIPGYNFQYGDYDQLKNYCKSHAQVVKLGGKNFLDKHYDKLTYEDWKTSFTNNGVDEFLSIYNIITGKL